MCLVFGILFENILSTNSSSMSPFSKTPQKHFENILNQKKYLEVTLYVLCAMNFVSAYATSTTPFPKGPYALPRKNTSRTFSIKKI